MFTHRAVVKLGTALYKKRSRFHHASTRDRDHTAIPSDPGPFRSIVCRVGSMEHCIARIVLDAAVSRTAVGRRVRDQQTISRGDVVYGIVGEWLVGPWLLLMQIDLLHVRTLLHRGLMKMREYNESDVLRA